MMKLLDQKKVLERASLMVLIADLLTKAKEQYARA
jgi:hypothetical protein